MWREAAGHVCPALLLRLEAVVGLVSPLVEEVEILKAVPFRQVLREALVVPPGFRNHPAYPSPYATMLGLILKPPVRCQV